MSEQSKDPDWEEEINAARRAWIRDKAAIIAAGICASPGCTASDDVLVDSALKMATMICDAEIPDK